MSDHRGRQQHQSCGCGLPPRDKTPPAVQDPALSQPEGRSAPASTVALATAAGMLGIGPDDAVSLAAIGAFPCSVIQTREGYRVPFAALMRLLGPRRSRDAPQ